MSKRNAIIIGFVNVKGGVGKTTISTNASHILASVGYKILHVDIDPQGSSCELFQPISPSGHILRKDDIIGMDIFKLLSQDIDAHRYIFRTKYENLDVIPNARSVRSVFEEGSFSSRLDTLPSEKKFTALYRNLERLREYYDFIIIDGQPSMDSITKVTVIASDYVLSPVTPDLYNMQTLVETKNMIDFCNTTYGRDTEYLGFFLNNVKNIKEVPNNPYVQMRDYYLKCAGEYFINIPIRYSESSEKSQLRRSLWLDYALAKTITFPNPCKDLLKLLASQNFIEDDDIKILVDKYGLKEEYFA